MADAIYLDLGEEKFECRRVAITWQMMKFAVTQRNARVQIPTHLPEEHPKRKAAEEKRNAAGMELLAIMHDTILILIKPDERDRFEEFMSTAELKPNELESAIGSVISQLGGADDTEGKPQQESSDSVDSQNTTSQTSRVISFAPDTAKASFADVT